MDEMERMREALAKAQSRADAAEQRACALAAGVPADRAERYVLLAGSYRTEEMSFEEALSVAIRDFPLGGKADAPRAAGPTAGPGTDHRWRDMSLTDRAALYEKDKELARRLAAADGEKLA